MYRSSKRHGVNINMTETFFEVKLKKKKIKQRQSLICSKNCEMNNFLAILELCAFYIDYKKVKLTAINFRGRINVNILCKHSLCDFVKIPQMFLAFPC